MTHVIMIRPIVHTSFAKDVRALVGVIEELVNPFEEESMDLVVLDTNEIAGSSAVETVRNVMKIGQEQFQAFTRDCMGERTKSINDAILSEQAEGVQHFHPEKCE